MGANRHNFFNPLKAWPVSRRFGICNIIVKSNDVEYLCLLSQYMITRKTCQEGKEGHEKHLQSIAELKAHLNKVQKDFKHS